MGNKSVLQEGVDIGYTEPKVEVNLEEFKKVINSRRSVRIFTDENIDKEIILDCIDMGLKAPNSSNLQPWEFYWIPRNSPKRKDLDHACLGQPAASTASHLIVCVGKTDTWRKHCKQMMQELEKTGFRIPHNVTHYYTKLAPFIYNQGPLSSFGFIKRILFFFRGLTSPVPRSTFSHKDMEIWAQKSCALACENIMLGIRAHGYDSCPMEGMDQVRVKRILNLPKGAHITMILGVGKRSNKGIYGPQIRFPNEQFVFEA
ncbi:MAG: nitroreductase [Thermoproteota archaeon]|jgi:nitroreductase